MSPRKKQAAKIPPTSPKARDAGPRLIPLREPDQPLATLRHLELADIALRDKKPQPRTRLRQD